MQVVVLSVKEIYFWSAPVRRTGEFQGVKRTMAAIMKKSSDPNAFVILSRTKHLNSTATAEMENMVAAAARTCGPRFAVTTTMAIVAEIGFANKCMLRMIRQDNLARPVKRLPAKEEEKQRKPMDNIASSRSTKSKYVGTPQRTRLCNG